MKMKNPPQSSLAQNSVLDLNQTWEMGRLVDLGSEYYNGMPGMLPPLPPFELREMDKEMAEICRTQSSLYYTQAASFCVQEGTCLETGAHLYPEMESVADVGLERLFVSTVVFRVPKACDESVTARDLEAALAHTKETVHPGDAVLVITGYDRVALNDRKAEQTPHLSYSAVEWVIQHKASILATDMSQWHDGKEEPNFWPMLMRSRVLVLPSLRNLEQIRVARCRLIALPMKLRGACAAPCRVIAVLPAESSA